MSISKSDSYAAAGVDVTAGYESVNRIKPLVESTNIPGVIGGNGYRRPVEIGEDEPERRWQ